MKELLTVLTRKGQITVPAEIRRKLGLRQGDKVALVMDEDKVLLRKGQSVVDRTAGALNGGGPPASAEELRERVEQAIADDVVERMEQ